MCCNFLDKTVMRFATLQIIEFFHNLGLIIGGTLDLKAAFGLESHHSTFLYIYCNL